MESLFISSLFNIIYAIALGIIGYILYGMSKNAPKTSEDKENLLNERASTLQLMPQKKL